MSKNPQSANNNTHKRGCSPLSGGTKFLYLTLQKSRVLLPMALASMFPLIIHFHLLLSLPSSLPVQTRRTQPDNIEQIHFCPVLLHPFPSDVFFFQRGNQIEFAVQSNISASRLLCFFPADEFWPTESFISCGGTRTKARGISFSKSMQLPRLSLPLSLSLSLCRSTSLLAAQDYFIVALCSSLLHSLHNCFFFFVLRYR